MKNNKAFTLVELLAVIVILAVILVIAVPQVLDVIDTTKVGSLESSAKLIANSAEKKYAEYLALGKDTSTIKCSDVTKLNDRDYGTCTISFDENGKATVSIKGKDDGKFEGLKCEGTKDNMVCGDIPPLPVINCSFTPGEEDFIKVYTVKDYDACMTNLENVVINEWYMTNEDLDGICKGTGDGYGGSTSENIEWIIADNYFTEQELIDLNVINVEKSDDLKTGTEYVHGQFTYRYNQRGYEATYVDGRVRFEWMNYDFDGWAVTLTDKESTERVTSEVCTYINDKPVLSMSHMFYNSKTESLDLRNFNTSNVIDMWGMFKGSAATNLDLSSFDTSNVKYMSNMFKGSAATSLDLRNFNTSNVIDMWDMFDSCRATSLDLSSFDTSNVTDMSYMFKGSAATNLDLSSFDTSNVTNMSYMFSESSAISLDLSSFDTSNVTNFGNMFESSKTTTGYARTQTDADKFNSSSGKPSALTFVVKGS